MNAPSNSEAAAEIEQLNAKPRYPRDGWEWDSLPLLPDCPRPKIVGAHDYDLVVNRKSRRPVELTVRKLFTEFREDFSAASDVFEPVHWRFLFYLDLFPLAAMGSPSFDARQTFQQIYDQDPSFVDVPKLWTGATESAEVLLWDIRARTADTVPDVAKATYAILSFARSLGLEKHEVLQVPFWQTRWIESYFAAHR